MCNAFSTEAFLSNESLASTSVDTRPGTMFKISLPNCTSRLSKVASTFSSRELPCFFPYSTATSMSLAYSGFLEAARIREGLVVASWGLYLSMVAKSPESQTTVYKKVESSASRSSSNADPTDMRPADGEELDGGVLTVPVALSWSREEDMIVVVSVDVVVGGGVVQEEVVAKGLKLLLRYSSSRRGDQGTSPT